MSFPDEVTFEFVDAVPSQREEGKIYISIPFSTAIHNCLCGCGMKVVTPIRPHRWSLTFDGDTVSFHPSVGNWSFPCQSHYIIRKNKVIVAGKMLAENIAVGRRRDEALRTRHYNQEVEKASAQPLPQPSPAPMPLQPPVQPKARKIGFWERLFGGRNNR